MNERKYFAISIKHTDKKWKFGKPLWLWGRKRTEDNEERCFSGYTEYPNRAELYSLQDWKDSGYWQPWMKIDEAVKMEIGFRKKYKEFDTVLVLADDYINYCKSANLPLSASFD